MTAPLKAIEKTGDVAAVMRDIGARAKAAGRRLALASTADKNRALAAMAAAVRGATAAILAANAEDIAEARGSGATSAFVDRLMLDDKRVAAIADGIDIVGKLADPVGTVSESWTRPNGMGIERVAMLKYGIPDLRTFYDADLRWLRHYGFLPLDIPSPVRGALSPGAAA